MTGRRARSREHAISPRVFAGLGIRTRRDRQFGTYKTVRTSHSFNVNVGIWAAASFLSARGIHGGTGRRNNVVPTPTTNDKNVGPGGLYFPARREA
jgi:hypothetical protein